MADNLYPELDVGLGCMVSIYSREWEYQQDWLRAQSVSGKTVILSKASNRNVYGLYIRKVQSTNAQNAHAE